MVCGGRGLWKHSITCTIGNHLAWIQVHLPMILLKEKFKELKREKNCLRAVSYQENNCTIGQPCVGHIIVTISGWSSNSACLFLTCSNGTTSRSDPGKLVNLDPCDLVRKKSCKNRLWSLSGPVLCKYKMEEDQALQEYSFGGLEQHHGQSQASPLNLTLYLNVTFTVKLNCVFTALLLVHPCCSIYIFSMS